MEQKLNELYLRYNYPGINKLYRITKENNININKKQITQFIKKQKLNQIYNPQHNKQGYITAFQPFDRVQIDLVDLQNFKRQNKGYRYILIVVDVFTRTIITYLIKDKTITPVKDALEKYLETYPKPSAITSDNEPSFTSHSVQKLFKDNDITHNTVDVGNHSALGVVDRAIQTIKNTLYKYMKENNTTKYYDEIKRIVDNYNKTPNEGILFTAPNDADEPGNKEVLQIFNTKKQDVNNSLYKGFAIGDRVRVAVAKKTFTRSYDEKYSDEVYTIESIKGHYATMTNNGRYALRRLKKIDSDDTLQERDTKPDAIKTAKRQARTERLTKQAGVEIENIMEGKRERRQKLQFQGGTF